MHFGLKNGSLSIPINVFANSLCLFLNQWLNTLKIPLLTQNRLVPLQKSQTDFTFFLLSPNTWVHKYTIITDIIILTTKIWISLHFRTTYTYTKPSIIFIFIFYTQILCKYEQKNSEVIVNQNFTFWTKILLWQKILEDLLPENL